MSSRREDRKRILVFSASYGGLQGGVADALVRYLKNHRAMDASVQSVDFLERLMPNVNVLAKFGYQQSVQFFPSGSGTFDEVAAGQAENPVVHELATGGYERAAALLAEWRPDAVISTTPLAAGVASDLAMAAGFFSAAVLTDFTARGAWLHPRTDAYFVTCREVSDELVVHGIEWGRITVAGLPVSESAKARSRRAARMDVGLAERFTALIIASSATAGEIPAIASQLAASGVQVALVTADAPRLRRQTEALAATRDLVRAVAAGTHLADVLSAADVAVCKAGEVGIPIALSIGCPLILYNPIPGQERFNVDFLVNCGAALLGRDEEDVVHKVRFLSTHPERREQIAGEASALGRSDAAQVVCERVLAAG